MKRVQIMAATAALASALTLGVAAPASATDYNVNAATNTNFGNSVQVTLAQPGTYSLSPIGVAQGGLYNGWNPNSPANCTGNACSSQWEWVYEYFSSATTIQIVGNLGFFATDLGALNAAQAAPTLLNNTFNTTTSLTTPGSTPNPYVFTIGQATTFGVFINDNDGNSANNLGGVSFRITAVSVPEPATWAMMIAGFGLVGLGLRRRRALAVA